MADKKPNKYDLKARIVTAHAIEIDWPHGNEISAIFGGRIGEYRTTREVVLPAAIMEELSLMTENENIAALLLQLVPSLVLSAFHKEGFSEAGVGELGAEIAAMVAARKAKTDPSPPVTKKSAKVRK